MLVSLHVKNLAVIREEEVTFERGLNILTGETGAGKSILLGSVELFLTGKADRTMIRQGADQALAELIFQPERPAVLKRLSACGIEPEDGFVVLSKKLAAGGRTLSRINGETVSAAVMREAASLLLDVHGQQDSQMLKHTRMHEGLLDAYAGEPLRIKKAEVAELCRTCRTMRKELAEMTLDESERKKQLSLLRYEIEEITKASLKPGEDEELEAVFLRLSNGQKIAVSSGKAGEMLSGEGGVIDRLGEVLRELDRVAEYDTELSAISSKLLEVESLLGEAAQDTDRYLDHFSYSEEQFAETQERLDTINRLKDRYGSSIEAVLAYREERAAEEEELLHYEERTAAKKETLSEKETALRKAAADLTALRTKAASAFSQEVEKELKDLNFLSVSFSVKISPKEEIQEDGADDVVFFVSLNPGEPEKPLAQVASGGELSRIMLGIRTVLADRDEIPTIIFDEIDAGISGRTAQKVADKLALIAKSRQVICITHLAQIAAVADAHYLIEKSVEEGSTCTAVHKASEEESVRELARILGGREITETVLASAREMKKLGDRKTPV